VNTKAILKKIKFDNNIKEDMNKLKANENTRSYNR